MFPKIIFAVFVAALSLAFYRRRRSLPPAVIFLIVALFFSRIYWRLGGFTLRWESIACLALVLNFALDVWEKRETFALEAKTGLVLALFPFMMISSGLVSPDPLLSLKKTLIYVPYLLAFTALVRYFRQKERLVAAWDIFYAAGSLALSISTIGLVLFLRGIDLGMVRAEAGTLWLRGTFIIPNILGSTAVLILIIALVRLTSPRGRFGFRSWPHAAALVPATACVLTSMTRSAWICAAFGIILVAAFAFQGRRAKPALVGLAVIAASAGLAYWVTTRMPARLGPVPQGKTLGEYGEPGLDLYWKPGPQLDHMDFSRKTGLGNGPTRTLMSRVWTAKTALDDWRLSPIIGRGTESLSISHGFRRVFYISSTWLSILHDWGLVALGIHLAFLVLVFLGLWKAFRASIGPPSPTLAFSLLLIFILSTVMNQVSTTMQISVFWVLMAFFAAGSSPALIEKQEVSDAPSLKP